MPTMTISDDVAEQAEQTFKNIDAALQQAGFAMADVVRVHYLLATCRQILRRHGLSLKKWFGDVRPAATMFEAGLADPRMKIEIEVTAFRG